SVIVIEGFVVPTLKSKMRLLAGALMTVTPLPLPLIVSLKFSKYVPSADPLSVTVVTAGSKLIVSSAILVRAVSQIARNLPALPLSSPSVTVKMAGAVRDSSDSRGDRNRGGKHRWVLSQRRRPKNDLIRPIDLTPHGAARTDHLIRTCIGNPFEGFQ